jgi:hypothetical protein
MRDGGEFHYDQNQLRNKAEIWGKGILFTREVDRWQAIPPILCSEIPLKGAPVFVACEGSIMIVALGDEDAHILAGMVMLL